MNTINNSNGGILILMGSESDWTIMKEARDLLKKFEIPVDAHIASAHRLPDRVRELATHARENGFKAIIAGAGAAAHLPGVVAAFSDLPVIGVPIAATPLQGTDSLYAIVQMPRGIPVATVAINGAANAAILALEMLSIDSGEMGTRAHKALKRFREEMRTKAQDQRLPLDH